MTDRVEHISTGIVDQMKDDLDWPKYAVARNGEDTPEDVVPAYYRVEGPNGPVRYVNPGSDAPHPTTMYGLLMESEACEFNWVPRKETPFPEFEDNDTEYYYGDEHNSVAEVLAEETGRPVEEFKPDFDEYPLPEPEELTTKCADCGEVLGDGTATREGHECGADE